VGLRERKKEKTRLALLDAALDLFLEQGYESTTVEQIAGSVDVSSRTFFRYFTGKEHLALWFHDHSEEILLGELRSRPESEPPFASLAHALRAVLLDMEESTSDDSVRFLKIRRLYEANPILVGKSAARAAMTEKRLADEVAGRLGVDPVTDQFPHLIVAFAMSTLRVGFECPRAEVTSLPDLVERVESAIRLAERSLRPGWDLPG
jgi:AcrR family transcriptional regulator